MEDINNNEEYIKTLETKVARLETQAAHYKLLADALQADPEQNRHIKEFMRIINEDFLKFANKEESCPNEAEMYQKLLQSAESLRLIAASSELYTKNTGAIGGGFSSGKSSFINSFVKDENLRLPYGVDPVTYIPSYVSVSDKPEIKGHTAKGSFDISTDVYKSLSHTSKKIVDSKTDLKTIIPYITVSCPMNKDLFGNICLIDTPGYNSPVQGFTQEDKKTASDAIQKAQFLIWVIDIEKGTITDTDVGFLKEHRFGLDPNLDLYIVLNKADRKSQDTHEDILDNIADTLDDNDFDYSGISVYSSHLKKEYLHKKTDLKSFLKEQNELNEKESQVDRDVKFVLDTYKKCIEKDINSVNKRLTSISSLRSLKAKNSSDDIDNFLESLRDDDKSKIEQLEEHLKELERIRGLFRNCIISFCSDLGIQRKHKKFCTSCGEAIKENAKFCPKCGESAFVGL